LYTYISMVKIIGKDYNISSYFLGGDMAWTDLVVERIIQKLNPNPNSRDDNSKKQAELIVRYSTTFAHKLLWEVNFPIEDIEGFVANLIFDVVDPPQNASSIFAEVAPLEKQSSLVLRKIFCDLGTGPMDDVAIAHQFVFCNRGIVIEWDQKNDQLAGMLSYEETAKIVLDWLFEMGGRVLAENRYSPVLLPVTALCEMLG